MTSHHIVEASTFFPSGAHLVRQRVYLVLEHHNGLHKWASGSHLSELGASLEAKRCEMATLEVEAGLQRA